MIADRRTFYLDLAERVGWTFIQGFLAFWIVTGDVAGQTLTAALVAGAISAGKALLAVRVGDHGTAATLPRARAPRE